MYKLVDGRPYEFPDHGTMLTQEQYLWALKHPGASEAEVLAMEVAPPPAPTLEELKAQKLQALYAWYAQKVQAGYVPQQPGGAPYSFALKITQDALDLWNKDLTRVSTALQLGDVEEGELEYFYDASGSVQALPVAEYARVLARLGRYFKNEIWAVTEAVKDQIAAAQAADALERVAVPQVEAGEEG